jgi:hypothetical protein
MQDCGKNVKKRKRVWPYALAIVLLLLLVAVATNYNVLVRWAVRPPSPTIELTHPDAYETIPSNVTYFSWIGSGGGGPLWYVWYCDVVNTFNSPLRRVVDTGTMQHYTASFMDGTYYWRVEVTDNITVAVSETRKFTVKKYATNSFPYLTDGSVTPTSGYNDIPYVYKVTFNDPNNNPAAWVRAYIDRNPFNMIEQDISDLNTIDGKIYTYATLLSVGSHNYTFFCSDGFAINHTGVYLGPNVTQTPGGRKMNKVTIQADNTNRQPGEIFTGNLLIIQENKTDKYEVYWYVSLLDIYDRAVNFDSGSSAILTSITVAYSILVSSTANTGNYRLEAKTYDRPRSQAGAELLGTDSIEVTVGGQSWITIIQNALGTLGSAFGIIPIQFWFVGIMLAAAVIYLFWRGRGIPKNNPEKSRREMSMVKRRSAETRSLEKKMTQPERGNGSWWKVAFVVIVATLIIAAGWIVLPRYLTPTIVDTTFTDASYRWIRQEAPNLTTFTGNGSDGDWGTWEPLSNVTNGTYYFCNYNVRVGAVGAVWEVKDSYGRTNYTMPAATLSEAIIKVQGYYDIAAGTITYQLYYGSAWYDLATRVSANEFYEEAILWKFPV